LKQIHLAILHLVEQTQFAKRKTELDLVHASQNTTEIHTQSADPNVLKILTASGSKRVSMENVKILVQESVEATQFATLSIILRLANVYQVILETL
jgi:hypothetical protein